MCRLLVTLPSGEQDIIAISDTGEYYDQSRVLWDERTDGDLPSGIQLGRMKREGNDLVTLDDVIHDHAEAIFLKQVPIEVPMTAAREALMNAGLFNQIEQYINTQSDVDKMWWDKATSISVVFPLVERARVALGMTQRQIYELFIAAEEIRKSRSFEI